MRLYLPAPSFLADAMVEYYLRYEPEWALLAEVDDPERGRGSPLVAGYVLGCPDTAARDRRAICLLPGLAWSFLRHGLAWSRAGLGLVWRGIPEQLAGALQRRRHPAIRDHPAHLHLAVDPRFRRRGIATALMGEMMRMFREAAIRGVHVETTSRHTAALALYERLGFARLASRRTRLFDHLLPPEKLPVQWLLMGRRL